MARKVFEVEDWMSTPIADSKDAVCTTCHVFFNLADGCPVCGYNPPEPDWKRSDRLYFKKRPHEKLRFRKTTEDEKALTLMLGKEPTPWMMVVNISKGQRLRWGMEKPMNPKMSPLQVLHFMGPAVASKLECMGYKKSLIRKFNVGPLAGKVHFVGPEAPVMKAV